MNLLAVLLIGGIALYAIFSLISMLVGGFWAVIAMAAIAFLVINSKN